MGLVELGKHTGLSPALLSKIERGPCSRRCRRCCASRWCSASAWSSSSPAPGRSRSSPSSARRIGWRCPERPGTGDVAYRFESLDFPATERRFNAYLAEFFPVADDAMRPHHHPGVEFIHTLHGTLGVHMNGEVHRLEAGDSIYFDANLPHAYRRENGRTCTALVVTAA